MLVSDNLSPAEILANLSEDERAQWLEALTTEEKAHLRYVWKFWARPNQLPPTGLFNTWLVLAGRGFGKGLSLTTVVPTPTGWTTIEQIQDGDELFDESGNICQVIKAHTPYTPEKLYEVTFSDKSTLIADAPHQWVTWTHRDRKQWSRYGNKTDFPDDWANFQGQLSDCWGNVTGSYGPKVQTTQSLCDTLKVGAREDANHCIPLCKPIQCPEVDFPIDLYTLGIWLGDGSKSSGEIASSLEDWEEISSYIPYSIRPFNGNTFGCYKLITDIRLAGLYKNKYVPNILLRSSVSQRLALLQGLMDTDGGIDSGQCVSFSNTNKNLIDSVFEIVSSLGEKPKLESRQTYCYKPDGSKVKGAESWRVQWTPSVFNPFKLKRKSTKITFNGNQSKRNKHRMITSIREIECETVKCLTVNSPNSLFLVGKTFIPTHNTRMGSEWIRQIAAEYPGCRIALVAETAADARDVMILGDSGIVACDPLLTTDSWSPTNRRLSWPNGSTAWCYNATEPDQLRGPQHHFAWVDELAKFRYMQETWDQLQFGLRLGKHPKVLVTTTPRPLPLIKKLMGDADTVVTRGSTLDNQANLAANTIKQLYERYGGTRLGRQELEGQILNDIPGALWNRDKLDENRRKEVPLDLERVLVAVDPAVSNNEGSDEHGIVVVGLARDEDGYARGYVLADGSLRGSPEDWARQAVQLYRDWEADKIIAEKNQGGDMVETVIRSVDRTVPVKLVHASRGKVVRAEPISALYDQGRVHHVGTFNQLEDQMCLFSIDNIRNISNGSPDRVDALVWGLSELFDKITGRRKLVDKRPSTVGKKEFSKLAIGQGAWLAR